MRGWPRTPPFSILVQQVAQLIQTFVPASSLITQPLFRRLKTRCAEPGGAHPAGLFGMDQPTVFQHLEMLRNSGDGDIERRGEMRNRSRTAAQSFDYGAAGGVTQSMEDAVGIRCDHCGASSSAS